jgi:hypothetical protein
MCGVKRCTLTPLPPLGTFPVMTDSGSKKKRRQIGPRVESDLIKEVQILAIRQSRRFNDLVDEAFRDLLKKYGDRRKDAR